MPVSPLSTLSSATCHLPPLSRSLLPCGFCCLPRNASFVLKSGCHDTTRHGTTARRHVLNELQKCTLYSKDAAKSRPSCWLPATALTSRPCSHAAMLPCQRTWLPATYPARALAQIVCRCLCGRRQRRSDRQKGIVCGIGIGGFKEQILSGQKGVWVAALGCRGCWRGSSSGSGSGSGSGSRQKRGKMLQSRVSSSSSCRLPSRTPKSFSCWRRLLLGSCLHACYAYLLTTKYMNIYVYIDLYACYCFCSCLGSFSSWHSCKGGGLASTAMSASASYWQPWQSICCPFPSLLPCLVRLSLFPLCTLLLFAVFRVDWDHVTQSIIASSLFCCHNFCPRANASNPILKWPGPPFYTRVCVCKCALVFQRCSWWVFITRRNRFIVARI